MNKEIAAFVVAAAILIAVNLADGQQPGKVPRIGVLYPDSPSASAPRIKAFQQGLRELGYVDGKNIIVEVRHAEGKRETLPELAAELARLKVDVIITVAADAIAAAKNASKTIPIVFAAAADPVADGFVSSLAKPGGNITGLTLLAPELNGKRLELLKEAVPKVTRVAFLWRLAGLTGNQRFKENEAVAKALGLQLQSVAVNGPDDLEKAFETIRNAAAQALTASPSPFFSTHRARIIAFTAKNRLAAVYSSTIFVDAGGLMSYGPDVLDNNRRAAQYVDKILKGAKPADLPVQQPTKFEFVINLKAAKQIGLTIPPNVLARADRVIK